MSLNVLKIKIKRIQTNYLQFSNIILYYWSRDSDFNISESTRIKKRSNIFVISGAVSKAKKTIFEIDIKKVGDILFIHTMKNKHRG